MKAVVGSLLFIKDKLDETKQRPYICMHVFSNNAGIAYNWLVMPITSNDSVGTDNLVEVTHRKLTSKSWVKINNLQTIAWSDEIEVQGRKFRKQYIKDVRAKVREIFNTQKDE
jgi:hypothetical protein